MESSSYLTKDYKRDAINDTLSKIKSFLKDNDISNAKINVQSLYLADGEKTFTKNKNIKCSLILPVDQKDKAAAFRKKFKEDLELGELIEIECSVKVGEQFQPIEGVDRPEVGGEENLTISHTEGTVLLVDFWATWCGPCQKPMAHNQEMLQKNEEKWKGRVRIVGASLDQDRKYLLTRIKERGWDNIDHFVLPGNWQHSGVQTYGCTGIPHVVLVNKVGKVVFKGHPSELDLEEEINRLLAEEPKTTETVKTDEKAESTTENAKENGVEKGVPAETYKKLRNLIKGGNLKSVTELNGLKEFIRVFSVLQHSKQLDSDLKVTQVSREKLMAGGAMTSEGAELFKKNLTAVTEGIADDYVVKKLQVLETTKIEFGSSCNSCSKPLTNNHAQYWCFHDKTHLCKACGDREDAEKYGVERFVNPHALIYLHPKDPSAVASIMRYRIGDQAQPKTKQSAEIFRSHRGAGCDACRETMNDRLRFKCLSCINIDVCGPCHEKIEGGDKDLAEKLKIRGHDVDTHILQRYRFCEDR